MVTHRSERSNLLRERPRIDGIDSEAQRQRRDQIMRVALELVLTEGYDGLQMRQVAAVAQVSTRTLYKHFPSKEHLLLEAMVRPRDARDRFLSSHRPQGRNAATRVRNTLGAATQSLQAVPALTSAMTKALVSGQASVIPIMIEFRDAMVDAIASAISPTGPTETDLTIARALQRIWFTALLAWSSGIEAPETVDQAIAEAVEIMLPAKTAKARPA